MPNLILIRHGQASFGSDNYDRLSPLGESQAAAVGVQLQRAKMLPDRVFCGDLDRQQKTAALALGNVDCKIKPIINTAFNEYDSDGVFTNHLPSVLDQFPAIKDKMTKDDYSILRRRDIFKQLFFPVMHQWIEGASPADHSMEPWEDFKQRVVSGIERIQSEAESGENVVVFTSGGVIAMAMTHLLGLPEKSWAEFNWRTPNASITRFVNSHSGLTLESYNQYSHLLGNELKVTYL